MVMIYDRKFIEPMLDELKSCYGQLVSAADDMKEAHDQMQHAWKGTAYTGFDNAYMDWKNAYDGNDGSGDGSSLHILNQIMDQVEIAMNRAFSTDHKIGQGFGA
ncbi:hypothetical protein ACFXHA_06770 [Nocardia sp. NPDC059240]|uniref:hypothetical protein n=1 Tax=Nocardia sp. NPDC059240 TaxID=3346786 RepID=UPI0036B2FFB2